MANIFSDNYQYDASDNYLAQQVDGSRTHARLRKKRMARATSGAVAINTTLTLGTFKSSDRIYDLRGTWSDLGSAGDIDLGLYKASLDHVPVAANLIQADLFCDAEDVNAAAGARVDWFTEAGVLADLDRGKALWELAAIGDGSYTADPMEDWDLVLTFVEATTAAGNILVEADFVSFG